MGRNKKKKWTRNWFLINFEGYNCILTSVREAEKQCSPVLWRPAREAQRQRSPTAASSRGGAAALARGDLRAWQSGLRPRYPSQ